ncbi:hypothetical protein GCM10010353_20530 [Streptomyces chryseus]|uniref:DUF3017 domain-containing protein n=1 Tax=Streptomyces chryseus TaxID=68186 RepID=UPI00110FC09E|nr:DUF3017 domain-containing protein [Streptomyces chryseus]GGX04778.1 hypothetical protein GCM10010353_20530 [Streptomyces chryseus]
MGAATSPDEPAVTDGVAEGVTDGVHDVAPRTDAAAPEAAGTGGAEAGTGEAGAGEPRAGADEPEAGADEPEAEPVAKGVVSAPGPDGPVRTTRRFPLLTRDTARPEGGGRAASGDAAAPVRQWPFLVVLGTTALGLLLVAVDAFGIGFRLGTLLIGLALISGAVLRRLVPSVGMLAVRSRFTDMATYGLLGFVIVMLALMAQPGPWLEIPLLEQAVRFTVR